VTKIGSLTISSPSEYVREGSQVSLTVLQAGEALFQSLKELFLDAEYGTVVHEVPGSRPIGEDLTPDNSYTVYCLFTHGTSGKPDDGYHLLRGYTYFDDESPEGHSYVMMLRLFYLGSTATLQDGYIVFDLEEEENDWDI